MGSLFLIEKEGPNCVWDRDFVHERMSQMSVSKYASILDIRVLLNWLSSR
jgi:hypothetical protein